MRFVRSVPLAQFFAFLENAECRITTLNKVLNFSKLNPNTPSLMDGDVLLFKCKKAPEYRRLFAYPAASQGGEDALVIAMMGGSLLLLNK